MEFFKRFRRKSFISELAHVGLNVAFAAAILVIVLTVASPLPALLLVLLSKWRVLAVRPRYWIINMQANLVDFIVSISVVMVMYSVAATGAYALWLQIVLTAFYIVWLVVVKPRSSLKAIRWQAGTSLVFGTLALFIVSYGWPSIAVVAAMALIGYVAARHVLAQYKEDHLQFLALLFALIVGIVAWLLNHWVIAYTAPIVDVRIPQAVFIVAAFAFVLYICYDSYKTHDTIRSEDIILPLLFSAGLVTVLLLFFNNIPVGVL